MCVIIYLSMSGYMHVSMCVNCANVNIFCFMLVLYLVICVTKSTLGVCVFYLFFYV